MATLARVSVSLLAAERAAREVDWAAIDALSDADIEASVANNPNAAPLLTAAETAQAVVRGTRKTLCLSQAVFAKRYRLSVATLRDWEQGRSVPDQAAFALMLAIQRDPETMARLLRD